MTDYLTAPLMGEALGLPIKKKALAKALTGGQARTAWLNDKARKAEDTLGYYLGPAAKPIEALGAVLDFTDAGDMVAAADASRELWNNPSIGSAANYAAAGAAMALPFYSARMGQGFADLADDARRFVTDEDGAIRLWHGSPHDFDKFSMDAIGTGEGAQAYGHGLYFAENKKVAQDYRDGLSRAVNIDGKDVQYINAADEFEKAFQDMGLSATVRDDARWYLNRGFTPEQFIDDLRNQDPESAEKLAGVFRSSENPGRLYEVDVNANPEDFLDFDAPFEAQPDAVQRHFAHLARRGAPPDGSDLARRMEGNLWIKEAADAGIPGIKYLDAGSRGAGDGSRNYVVFDENLIQIVRKYGIAGAAAVLGVSASDVQAAIQPMTDMQADEETLKDYLGL